MSKSQTLSISICLRPTLLSTRAHIPHSFISLTLLCPLPPLKGTCTSIEALSPASALFRVLTGVPQILAGGRFFDREGRRVPAGSGTSGQYKENGVRLPYDIPEDKY